MVAEGILMSHVVFGVLGVLGGIWVFAEVLHVSESNMKRIKYASIATAMLIWLSYLLGGYWYVEYYGADKAIIKSGPWPWAHSFIMEVKEHIFFSLLLLGTFLPIAVYGNSLHADRSARNLVLTVSGLIVFIGLGMEGFGAVIAMGVKMGLLAG